MELEAKEDSGWISNPTFDILNTCRHGQDFSKETGAHFDAQAHISTEPSSPSKNARLPRAHEDQERRRRSEPPPCRRPQARRRKRRLPRLIFTWGRNTPSYRPAKPL